MQGQLSLLRSWVAVLLVVVAPAIGAAPAQSDALTRFFSEVQGFKADFEQTLFDENLVQLQTTSGSMALERPGRFRWDYSKPYEQHIVGDGKKVWIYDVELEQVTVKSMTQALGDTPAQLLSTTEPLQNNFKVETLGLQNGLMWFQLKPLAAEAQFNEIRLGFEDATIKRMELEDGLGTVTLLEFENVQKNPVIDDKFFRFTPPPNADVIGDQ